MMLNKYVVEFQYGLPKDSSNSGPHNNLGEGVVVKSEHRTTVEKNDSWSPHSLSSE